MSEKERLVFPTFIINLLKFDNMEAKKNPKANLEKSRGIFFQIGLIAAMAAVFLVFNFATSTKEPTVFTNTYAETFEQEEIINTEQKPDVKIIPPAPKTIEVLMLTSNETETKNNDFDFSSETTEDEAIPMITMELTKEDEGTETIIDFAEKMPEFPGGEIGLRKFIYDHVKYPPRAIETNLEGKIYVRFCVNSKGMVERVSIARGVDPILDNEAMRVVKGLPKWKPGENGGRKVNVWYTVPISFKLNN